MTAEEPQLPKDVPLIAPTDDEVTGQQKWWRDAILLEGADKLNEAEQTILDAIEHIGVYSSLAYMYESRMTRLLQAGNRIGAEAARKRAIEFLNMYASSATSGGEGMALSQERDERTRALGGPIT